jgi:hypothetical protein
MALQPHLVEIVFGMVLAMALILAATTWAFSPESGCADPTDRGDLPAPTLECVLKTREPRRGDRDSPVVTLHRSPEALGSSARKLSAFQGGDAGGVIAPVFEPLERVDKRTRDRLPPENAHNSAHASGSLLCLIAWTIPRRRCIGGEH